MGVGIVYLKVSQSVVKGLWEIFLKKKLKSKSFMLYEILIIFLIGTLGQPRLGEVYWELVEISGVTPQSRYYKLVPAFLMKARRNVEMIK